MVSCNNAKSCTCRTPPFGCRMSVAQDCPPVEESEKNQLFHRNVSFQKASTVSSKMDLLQSGSFSESTLFHKDESHRIKAHYPERHGNGPHRILPLS